MPTKHRKTADQADQAEKPRGAVFRYEQLIGGRLDGSGPDTAAVAAARNAGYRPTGEATAECHADPENDAVRVVWSVPVEGA